MADGEIRRAPGDPADGSGRGIGSRLLHILRLWFGISEPVGRRAYALTGFSLALLKYVVEASVIWHFTSIFFAPWYFFNPVLTTRMQMLESAPEWVAWALFLWTLPFIWIAVSMSVRRAADMDASPWLGLVALVPLFNLPFMLALCLIPGTRRRPWTPAQIAVPDEHRPGSAVLAIVASLGIGALMLVTSVYLVSNYGASLFIGTPVLMGASAAYFYNRSSPHSYGASVVLGMASILFAGFALMLFALEGVICILMAIPLILPMGALGGAMGKAIADSTRRPSRAFLAVLALLPLFAGAESLLGHTQVMNVMTAVEIDAPPSEVWKNVIAFPEITTTPAWYFRLGIACPERARIVGRGVGATRYCEFTTGTFVEPITHWEESRRLAFDVTEQPEPMFELTPYRHVHPPHLDGALRSHRGEFRLIALPQGRTRLEGRTWYELKMAPGWYWTLWTQTLIHRIHERVLVHIKQHSEDAPRL